MNRQQLEVILYAALDSPKGILVYTSSPDKLKQRLYITRAEARKNNNLDFDSISFQVSPTNPQGELWLTLKPTQEMKNAPE